MLLYYCRLYHVIFTLDIFHTTNVYHPSVWRITDLESPRDQILRVGFTLLGIFPDITDRISSIAVGQ